MDYFEMQQLAGAALGLTEDEIDDRIKKRTYPRGWYFYKGGDLEEAILYVDSKGNWSTPNGAFTPDLSKIGKKFL